MEPHVETSTTIKGKKKFSLYQSIWRWHFYAGMIFTPILVMLSITGSIYLFRPYLEPQLNKDMYYVSTGSKELTPSLTLKAVKDEYPTATITSYTNIKDPKRATEIGIINNDIDYTVFVNPYNGEVLGKLVNDNMLMNIVVKLHGELMVGKIGDNLIELAASWAIILLLTGLYLYFPRNKQTFLDVFRIRTSKGSRIFWRDIHSTTGFWMTIGILLFVLTGLPWASSFGDRLSSFVENNKLSNAPVHLWDGTIQSTKLTKEVAKTTWSAQNIPVPKSVYSNEGMLPIEKVVTIADKTNVYPGYTINFPQDDKGVYTVSTWGWAAKSVNNYVTMHIDQYSGQPLIDYRWKDYSKFDKLIEIGIALHEGRYFGITNLIIDLILCLSLILIVITGIIMWWKRRPTGKIGIPKATEGNTFYLGILIISLICGLLMPLVGISIFIIGLLEFTVRLLMKTINRKKLEA